MVSQRCFFGLRISWLGWAPLLLLASSGAWAQTGPRIQHDGLNCVLSGQHLKLQAFIEPVEGLATVKAYFRADAYPQFYYVEMVRNGDFYEGLLPKPNQEISGIHYYLEAMDESFHADRTPEFTPQVVGNEAECKEDNPVPPAYANPAGNIAVGSTSGPAFPPGFGPESLIAIPRVLGPGGGGIGAGTIGGIVAAGAGAAVVGVLASDGGTPTSIPVVTTSVPGPTTTIGGGMTPPPAHAGRDARRVLRDDADAPANPCRL